jgi:hypothetical protein
MLKFLTNTLVLSFIFIIGNSQVTSPGLFSSPLDIPLFLAGNYGELRATHFHAGVDFRTQSVTGKPVYSAASGYVSRINIQSGGYGRSIYISHPNGYTTVYAHLESFIPEIQEYVEQNQYEKEQFEIELFPSIEQFRFNQGDLIAYSGNTGSSGGPHLHFEIRNTGTQVPINGLLFDFPVSDNIPPVYKTLYLYSYPYQEPVLNAGEKRSAYDVIKRNDTSYTVKGTILITSPYFSFGSEVYDYLNGSSNRCGIYEMELRIDGKPCISYSIDGISFGNGRYVNAHMDYELKINEKRSVHRMFPLMNNKLPIYNKYGRNELYHMQNDSMHRGEIIAVDSYGNRSKLNFTFRQSVNIDPLVNWQDSLSFVRWDQGAVFRSDKINIQIPQNALYEDIVFNYMIVPGALNSLSDTFHIFTSDEPLHESIRIEVPVKTENIKRQDKLLFGRVDKTGKLLSEGGSLNNGIMSLSTRNFGNYVITCDTSSPAIMPVNFVNMKKYAAGQKLTFTVTDDLSGLDTYKGFIDGRWILMEYDAKSDTMSYTIDKGRLEEGQIHNIQLIMTDKKKNRSVFEGKFLY